MTRDRPGAFSLPMQKKNAFESKLRKAARDIRSAAAGRVCGDCTSYIGGQCGETISPIDGGPSMHDDHAVACSMWVKRKK